VAPYYNQAKTVAWDVIREFARPVLASAPNEAELHVHLLLIRYGEALFDPKPSGILVRAERIGRILNRVALMDLDAPRVDATIGHRLGRAVF
jgi:hypothetical protein